MSQKYAAFKFCTLSVKYLSMPMIQLSSLTAHNHHSPGLFTCWTHSLRFRGLGLITTKQRPFGLVRVKVHTLPFPRGKPILWVEEKVYALGVWFSMSDDKQLDANFMEKIIKIESILNSWSARRLTLLGKITIIKSLAVSQIVYLLSALPTAQEILQKIIRYCMSSSGVAKVRKLKGQK